jgi:putative DNA primase/helicase
VHENHLSHGLFSLSILPVSTLQPLPSIADVYERLRGEPLAGAGDERRGHCLHPEHKDANPSCDYNVEKDTFHCKVCERFGGVLPLVVFAGKAENNRAARKWLRTEALLPPKPNASGWKDATSTYRFVNEAGTVVYEVGRWDLDGGGKQFRQRVPDGKGGYKESKGCLNGVERVPYRLQELLEHLRTDPAVPVFVVEGEKDANNLAEAGATVTTSAEGTARAWPLDWKKYFVGLSVVYVLADNDAAGHKAALQRARLIATVVPDVRVLFALPGVGDKGDVSDWLEEPGHDLDALRAICAEAETVVPYAPTYDAGAVTAIVADRTDMGTARWFVQHYSEVTCFVNEAKTWFAYQDGVWEPNKYLADKRGKAAMDSLMDAANDYSGQDAERFHQFAEASRSLTRRKAMIETAQSDNIVTLAAFDAHPMLLNCANGTLDLGDFSFHDHRAKDMLTLKTPIAYDSAAACPQFEAWLRECVRGDEQLFEYIQQVMGSCLEGKPGARAFYFIFGPKGTGKSTFVGVLEALLGPYQWATDFGTLAESHFGINAAAASPQLAALRGMRMVSAAEARGEAKLDASRIKQLIGGDVVTARFLNQDLIKFRFEATLIMSGNEMPRIVGDESTWDKFKPVPFLNEIGGAEDVDYATRVLHPELSGILNFCLEGLRRLRAAKYKLVEPKSVTDARNAEFDEQDTFKDFVADCILKQDPTKKVEATSNKAVRELYVKYAKGRNQHVLDERNFYRAMTKHGIVGYNTNGVRKWKDIKLVQMTFLGDFFF